MVPSAYQVIDISSSDLDSSLFFIQPTLCMMYSAQKLNKQGDNIQHEVLLSHFGTFPVLFLDLFLDLQISQEVDKWSGIFIS